MKRLAHLLPILALALLLGSGCREGKSPPVRTLEEATAQLEVFLDNLDSPDDPFNVELCAIKIGTDAKGKKTWTFCFESVCWSDSAEEKGASEKSRTTTKIVTSVAFQVDSSGNVRELPPEPVEERSYPSLSHWYPGILSYCEAAGIEVDSLSEISTDAGTNLVLVVGTDAPLRVSREEIARVEKAYFLATIADADRIVIRHGGFDCCTPIELIDQQRILAVITNMTEIADFTAMIQFEDGPGNEQCLCCGYPGIDWYKSGKRVALTSVQHGRALRWRAFFEDYPFTKESAQSLGHWFKEHLGIPADGLAHRKTCLSAPLADTVKETVPSDFYEWAGDWDYYKGEGRCAGRMPLVFPYQLVGADTTDTLQLERFNGKDSIRKPNVSSDAVRRETGLAITLSHLSFDRSMLLFMTEGKKDYGVFSFLTGQVEFFSTEKELWETAQARGFTGPDELVSVSVALDNYWEFDEPWRFSIGFETASPTNAPSAP